MRRRLLSLGAVAVLALLVSGGCSSGHRSAVPTTLAGPNPDVIPAVITPAYVDSVFRVLNHVNGDAVRVTINSGQVGPDVAGLLRAIYGGPLYNVELSVFKAGLSQDSANLRRPPGDRVTLVVAIESATPKCIFVKTTSDLSAVELRPTARAASEYWRLQPKVPADDPGRANPTPWVLTYNQDFETPTTVPDQC